MITFNMIVFVHGYYSNGFIRPLEKTKKPKQTTEGNITRKCSTLSFCSTSQFDKSFKRSIRSPGTSMQATSWMICNSSASQLWSSSAWQSSWRVLRHDCHWLLQYQSSFILCCECTQFISPSRQTITQRWALTLFWPAWNLSSVFGS